MSGITGSDDLSGAGRVSPTRNEDFPVTGFGASAGGASSSEDYETQTADLRAANEELLRVNRELNHKIEELSRAGNDIQNLMSSMQIGTIFLDSALRVKLFTPAVHEIFNLRPSDVGRPLSDITHKLVAADLPADLKYVLADSQTIEREMETREGLWYLLRLLPYRTMEVEADGAIIIFIDITARKLAEFALEQSERDYRTVFEQAHDAIIVFAPEQEIVLDVNQRACEIYGFARSEFIGMSLEMLSKNPARGKEKVKQTLGIGDYLNFETVQYRKDESEMFLEINASKILYQGRQVIITINRDVTGRKQAEDALRASEEKFRSVTQTALDAIVSADSSDRIVSWNNGAEIMFGYSETEALGQSLAMLMPEQHREAYCKALERYRVMGAESRVAERKVELYGLRKNGAEFPLELSLSTWKAEGEFFYSGILRDITERVQAKEARIHLQQRLLTAQEEERRRISRELHDRMGQHLPALMLGLKALENAGREPPPADLLPRLQDLAAGIARDVHDMSRDLRPMALDDFGLQVALKHYAEEWSERHKITVDFHADVLTKERLAPQIEITLYRVAQEALTNIVKHSNARHASVILERRPADITLLVEDDGQGFNVEAVMETPVIHRRLGLLGMQERVTLAGGTLKIESDAGSGATVIARIPISQKKEAAVYE